MHVYIDGPAPSDERVPFTVVLRGADGGVVDGLSEVMSSVSLEDRTILRLHLTHVSTSGHRDLLKRFLGDPVRHSKATLKRAALADPGVLRAIHQRADVTPLGAPRMALGMLPLNKPAIWRGRVAQRVEILQSSPSGRSLVVRRKGAVPSAWETVRLEVDLGVKGEPRPVQLVGMVIGTHAVGAETHIVVRLVRWSADSDRVVWTRWLRHQERLAATPITGEAPQKTVTLRPLSAPGPPT